MADVLIAYASTEGRTAEIATQLAERLRGHGHAVTVLDTRSVPRGFSAGRFHAAIVAGSVHYGRHQSSLRKFVQRHREAFEGLPTVFASVSLSAGHPEATRHAERFAAETGWQPGEIVNLGGVLAYTRYSFLKRLLMRSIMNRKGGPTNTKRDWEFTDWRAVESLADRLAARLEGRETGSAEGQAGGAGG